MRRGGFYVCERTGAGGLRARHAEGYVSGEIGLRLCGGMWDATHIPSGLLVCSERSSMETRGQLLRRAKRIVGRLPELSQDGSRYAGRAHIAFIRSIEAQQEKGEGER